MAKTEPQVVGEITPRGSASKHSLAGIRRFTVAGDRCKSCTFPGSSDRPLVAVVQVDLTAKTQTDVLLHRECIGGYIIVHSNKMFQARSLAERR